MTWFWKLAALYAADKLAVWPEPEETVGTLADTTLYRFLRGGGK